jgi:hypothetical protein
MKRLLLLVFIVTTSLSIFSQGYIKDALKRGKNSEYFYEAIVPENTLMTPEKLSNWSKKNDNKYLIIDYKTREIWFAGSMRVLISWFAFVENTDLTNYNSMQLEIVKQRALAAEQRAKFDREMVGVIFGTAALAYYSAGYVINKAVENGFVTKEALMNPKTNNYKDEDNKSSTTEINDGQDEKKNPNRIVKQEMDNPLPNYQGAWNNSLDTYVVKFNDDRITQVKKEGNSYYVRFSGDLPYSGYYYKSFVDAVRASYYADKFNFYSVQGRK